MTCALCRYFNEKLKGGDLVVGKCTRYPPVWHGDSLTASQPVVSEYDYCGEFSRAAAPPVDQPPANTDAVF